ARAARGPARRLDSRPRARTLGRQTPRVPPSPSGASPDGRFRDAELRSIPGAGAAPREQAHRQATRNRTGDLQEMPSAFRLSQNGCLRRTSARTLAPRALAFARSQRTLVGAVLLALTFSCQ